MKFLNKPTQWQAIPLLTVMWAILFLSPAVCRSAQSDSEHIKQQVKTSIDIRQKTQKQREKWEEEKARLLLVYEKLKYEHQATLEKNRDLAAKKEAMTNQNQALLKQKHESMKIKTELFPFLIQVVEQLETRVSNDVPFLKEERSVRLLHLKQVMDDPEIRISEKYRKVMEALFIEAEYGATIEVYQEKIVLGSQDILGDIFRLGRVSLFFLSLDQTSCAYFNVASNTWEPLADDMLASIRNAVEIGSKRQPVELLSLPLGRLSTGEPIQ